MKKAIDIQKENLNILFELIKKNPDLPIIPMANYEIVVDDCSAYWMGSWGKARIESYCIKDERVWYLSDDRDEIFDYFFEMPDGLSAEQEERFVEESVSSLPWTKAIMVKIELPD